jgi:hypothetical protein
LIRTIGKRFGTPCDTFPVGSDKTETVTAFRLENESPWVKPIHEADNEGYVFTSNEAGGLYLWNAAAVVRCEGFKLVEGVNIKTIGWSFSSGLDARFGSRDVSPGSRDVSPGSLDVKSSSLEPNISSVDAGFGFMEPNHGSVELNLGSVEPGAGSLDIRSGSADPGPDSPAGRYAARE